MIIESLEIQNLFCYRRAEFDLAPTANRPLVVIQGRNGHGKTSFLNCLHLLFGGATAHLRSSAVSSGILLHNGYVWGEPSHRWDGILNRWARQRLGDEAEYFVKATLRDGLDRLDVKRSWGAHQGGTRSYEGELELRLNARYLKGKEAQERLDHALPPYALPYFFFDGELIQRMSVLSGGSLEEPVRILLGIERLSRLRENVAEVCARWAQEAADDKERRQLVDVENQLRSLEVARQLTREAKEKADARLGNIRQRRTEVQNQLSRIQVSVGHDRDKLQGQRVEIEESLRQATQRLYLRWLPLAPILFAPELVTQTREAIRAQISQADTPHHAQRELLESLAKRLPDAVFGFPAIHPPLTPTQIEQLQNRLRRQIEANIQPDPPESEHRRWEGLSRASATTTLATLERWDHSELRREAAETLAEMGQRRQHLLGIDRTLEDMSSAPDTALIRHRALQKELTDLSEEIGKLGKDIERYNHELLKFSQDEAKHRENQAQIRTQIARRQAIQSKARTAQGVKDLLVELEARAKASRRQQVTTALDAHFHTLFSSNRQVARLSLDEDFHLRIEDPDGDVVEPGALSSGTKQLIAVATLWALKEAAGKPLPIAIDTPIARLDLDHQDAILFKYLPLASEQVILLPTDSEVSPERLSRLSPHISHLYELKNLSGSDTQVTLKAGSGGGLV